MRIGTPACAHVYTFVIPVDTDSTADCEVRNVGRMKEDRGRTIWKRRSVAGWGGGEVDATRASEPVNEQYAEERTKRRRKRIQAIARKRTDRGHGRGGGVYTQLHSSLDTCARTRFECAPTSACYTSDSRAVLNIKPINRRGGAVTDGRGHLATPPIDGAGASSSLVHSGAAWREGEEGSCADSAATRSPSARQMRSGF